MLNRCFSSNRCFSLQGHEERTDKQGRRDKGGNSVFSFVTPLELSSSASVDELFRLLEGNAALQEFLAPECIEEDFLFNAEGALLVIRRLGTHKFEVEPMTYHIGRFKPKTLDRFCFTLECVLTSLSHNRH